MDCSDDVVGGAGDGTGMRAKPLAGLGREFGEALGGGPGLCLQFSPGGGSPTGLSHPHAIKTTASSQDTRQG